MAIGLAKVPDICSLYVPNQDRGADRGNGAPGNAPLGDFAGGLGAGRVGWIADLDVQTWSTRLRENGQ